MSLKIVMTGFGPFVGTSGKDKKVQIHKKNASWEAVKILKNNFKNHKNRTFE